MSDNNNKKDKYDLIAEMIDFINMYDVKSFYVLAEYARKKRPDWHYVLVRNHFVISTYLSSRRYSKKKRVH